MGKCSIKSCKNRTDKKSPKKVLMFSFPKNEDVKRKWMLICSMVKFPSKAYGCADHFEESDYLPIPVHMQNWRDHGINYSPKRRRIKEDAIPTKNLCPNVHLDSANDIIVARTIIKVANAKINNHVNVMANDSFEDYNVDQTLKEQDKFVSHERARSPNKKSLEENVEQSQVEQDKFISKKCSKSPNKHSSEEMDELKSKLQKLENENMRLKKLGKKYTKPQSVNKKIRNEKNCLLKENNTLKKNVKRLQSKTHTNRKIQDVLKNIFTSRQIYKIVHPERKYICWDAESIARAITIRSFSGSADRFLRQINYPLPSETCVKRWISEINIKEGIIEDVLYMMKSRGNQLQPHQKLVVLSFHEMYLAQRIDFDQKLEQVIGPHKTAQVCIARGLFMNWKQPIIYKYDQNLTSKIIDEIIVELWKIGYTVAAVVTDLGGNNPRAFKKYNIGIDEKQQCFFTHPWDEKLKIFVFADVPHLFKLFRNHYLDDGGYYIKETDENGQVVDKFINKKVIEEMLKLEEDNELRIAFRATQEQLDMRGATRQRVSLATELISKSNARAIRWCGEANLLTYEDWEVAADVFDLMNDWFDVFKQNYLWLCFGTASIWT